MGRYFAFFLGAFLIIGSGCHKASSPVDSGQNDSTANLQSLGAHYPYMSLSFSNVFISGYHYEDDDNKTIYDYHDTAVRSSSSYFWVPWSIEFVPNGQIVKGKNQIPTLSAIPSPNMVGAKVYADFKDITFVNYEPDSSIHIVLTGVEAGKHIIAMSNYFHSSQLKGAGVKGTYLETQTENLDYFKCTDSTLVNITLPYRK